jgi:hypothetical protein
VLFLTAIVAVFAVFTVFAGMAFGDIGEWTTLGAAGTATIAGFIGVLAATTGFACDLVPATVVAFAGIGLAAGVPLEAVGTGFAGIVALAAGVPGLGGSILAGAMVFVVVAGFVVVAVLVAVAGVVFAAGLGFGFAGACAQSVPHARLASKVAADVAIDKRCFSFITILNYLATGLLAGAAAGASRLK